MRSLLAVIGFFALSSCQKEITTEIDQKPVLEKGVYIFGISGNTILYTQDMKNFKHSKLQTQIKNATAYYVNNKIYVYAINPPDNTILYSSEDASVWKPEGTISRSDGGEPIHPDMYFWFHSKWMAILARYESHTSTDGMKWDANPISAPGMLERNDEIIYQRKDTLFLAGGFHFDGILGEWVFLRETWMSLDGVQWEHSNVELPQGYVFESIVTVNGISYAIAYTGTSDMKASLFRSADGFNWTEVQGGKPWAYMFGSRYNTALFTYKGKLYMFGGIASEAGPEYKDLWSYDGSSWKKELDEIPFSDWQQSPALRKKILVIE